MYLCLVCWEAYSRELEYCPKKQCYGDIINIDDDLVPIIVELNEKGYYTQFCCSGHSYNGTEESHPRTYILFDGMIKLEYFPAPPSGFNIKNESDGRVVLDAEYHPNKVLRTHAKVAKGIAKLALWVDKLPYLDEDILFGEEINNEPSNDGIRMDSREYAH